MEPLISVDSLSVDYRTKSGRVKALRNVSLDIHSGETLGIAGESGSGKSTLAQAILRYLGDNGEISSGSIQFKSQDLTTVGKKELHELRGRQIAHVPQDPEASLNPSLTVGEQITETIIEHSDMSKREARSRMHELLTEVEISDPEYNATRYPHQLSGGMKQRILIAMALSCSPELLILDEPTTGLDVTTQAKILELIQHLKEDLNTAILLISHNLSVIAQTCERLTILYAGEVMEKGTVTEVFNDPANPYTQGLLAALPRIEEDTKLDPIQGQIPSLYDIPSGCIFADRCEFAEDQCRTGQIDMHSVDDDSDQSHQTRCCRHDKVQADPILPETRQSTSTKTVDRDAEPVLSAENVKKHFGSSSFFDKIFGGEDPVRAVDGVSLDVRPSETLGLVGESGCGKSTLGSLLLRLLDLDAGTLRFKGEDITDLSGSDLREFRSDAQIVFQNPHSSLNPRKRIESQVSRPLELFTDMESDEREDRVKSLLDQVNLDRAYASRFPDELSGGEKQRVAIARAFAANPSFVVLDEPLSGLDVSVQASILNLLSMLKEDYDSSYLFISHDLSVVKYLSDRIAVMYLGEVVEVGSQESIFEPPYHPYTRALLSSNPSPDPNSKNQFAGLEGDVPSARNPPSGCSFHTRCPKAIEGVCDVEEPELESVDTSDDPDHNIACHLDESEMGKEL
ncbi:dipeptide ABC transporter ATP-binding protein [Natronorubrum sp. FCH18a]|uniref:dipeptide ABC transporter ATP-binding protein n=1 Tax=Natronorubrum sp. FCH18a TaxID=3447018 RepID=UPI003F512825